MVRRWEPLSGRFEEVLSAVVLAVMVGIAFANVLTRYLIELPLAFTEELTVNLFVWLVLLGSARAFREDAHLQVVFFVDKLPRTWRRWVHVLAHLVSLAVFAVVLVLGWQQVADEMWLGMTTQSLGIPMWYFTLGMPVGAAVVIVRIGQALRRAWRSPDEPMSSARDSEPPRRAGSGASSSRNIGEPVPAGEGNR